MNINYTKEAIKSLRVAQSSSPLSQGIKFGNLIFLSGQLGRNPTTGKLESGFDAQATRVMNNLKDILEDANSSMDMVLKTTIFVTNLEKAKNLNTIYKEYFSEPLPARSRVEVSGLGEGVEIEIELIAGMNYENSNLSEK